MNFARHSITFILALLAFLGGYFHVELFYRVDFLFGSIFALIALNLLGLVPALIISVIGGSYSIYLWGHPYAALIWTLEVFWTGLLYRRFRQNLVLAVGLYWLIIGMPLIWLFYGGVMGVQATSVNLVAVKQAVNAIFNAFIANSILLFTPIRRLLGKSYHANLNLTNLIWGVLIGAILLPLLIIVIIDGQESVKNLESRIKSNIELVGSMVKANFNQWSQQHIHAVQQLAAYAQASNMRPSDELQTAVQLQSQSFPDFQNMYVADHEATAIAFYPKQNKKGAATLGLNFSDREYFQQHVAGKELYISNVFMGRGGIDTPTVTISAGIFQGKHLQGYVLAALNLERLRRVFNEIKFDDTFSITLVDAMDRVIISNLPSMEAMAIYGSQSDSKLITEARNFYRYLPVIPGKPGMTHWEQSMLGKKFVIPQFGWSIYIEKAIAPYQNQLQSRFTFTLSLILALTMIGGLVAWFIARWLTTPLVELTRLTTNFPKAIGSGTELKWQKRGIFEIDRLGENFATMTGILESNFHKISETSAELAKTNEELAREIRERKQAEVTVRAAKDVAEAANKAKTDFLANMSHEMRTPLSVILGYTDLLLDPSTNPEELNYFLNFIKKNGEQLLNLINDILDLSKIEAGKTNIEITAVNVGELIKDGILMFEHQIKSKGLSLSIQLSTDIPYQIHTDPVRANQIFINIMGNALKFTSKGSITVTVSYDQTLNMLEFTIADTGIGIPPEQTAKLFEVFSQADSSTTRKFGGTGLGLALTKRLAKLLGGDVILLESQVDQGSTFKISLDAGEVVEERFCSRLEELLAEQLPT